MTLWSVDVIHLRIPVGPWSSWPATASCPWASWPSATPGWSGVSRGGAMTSVTVERTSCVSGVATAGVARIARVARGAVDVGVHARGELADGVRVPALERRRGVEPGLVGRRRDGTDVEEHQRVVEAAQLGALAPV